jgi:hypothetical protein
VAKGQYIKAAERACARKARFETAASAEAFAQYRFKAYLCPVCHHWHLTSKGRPSTEPEPAQPEPPGPKLRDLDWTALNPKPKPEPKPDKQKPPEPTPAKPQPQPEAHVVRECGKDGRALLNFEGKLVKSAKVSDPSFRSKLTKGRRVMIDGDSQSPKILGLSD